MNEHQILDLSILNTTLLGKPPSIPIYRKKLKEVTAYLKIQFESGVPVQNLVRFRTIVVDQLLIKAFNSLFDQSHLSLIAVGGYGRGELHPGSDVDIMLLLSDDPDEFLKNKIIEYITFLFDVGLDIGHSVRTLAECEHESINDITVATNLFEARLISGSNHLFNELQILVGPGNIWSSQAFFKEKSKEQLLRHHKYHDTGYNLEPNVKEGPGGLRDIHVIGWVAKRHFGAVTLHDLVAHKFLTESEYQALMEGQYFLWKIRFGLHNLTGRREDRLLFDHQRNLALQFGYCENDEQSGIEQFMKEYYRTIMELGRLNEMLLELFQETILYADDSGDPIRLNKRFQSRKGFIEVSNKDVFIKYPFALLEIFLLLAQNSNLRGVRASTIRKIRDHRYLIDDNFRNDLGCRSIFMEVLRQPIGVTHQLRRMNLYGILAKYIPAFGRIVGQMQHDMFHHYTVDEHTLFVIRNLRRFTVKEHSAELPLCSQLAMSIPKLELLYLAGLFHDIGKGRGGNHSELGAIDAADFCHLHKLSPFDSAIVVWLVKNHLLMSTTAQRKDISDPIIIAEFASIVGSQSRLEYLFLLTVADIRATNPDIWSAWKDALLTELFVSTSRALRRGLENQIDQDELIADTKNSAKTILILNSLFNEENIDELWNHFGNDYFLRHSVDSIIWHTTNILQHTNKNVPLVICRTMHNRQIGGAELFVYMKDQDFIFAAMTTAMDMCNLDIVDARIITASNGYTLDSYVVFENTGEPIQDSARIDDINESLQRFLIQPFTNLVPKSHHISRRHKAFSIKTEIFFRSDPASASTIMELVALDRSGLLSKIGIALMKCGVRLKNAKIATFGERAEDIFFITDKDNNLLTKQSQFDCLKQEIIQSLDID